MEGNLRTDLKLYDEAPGSHHILKDVYGFFGTSLSNSVAVYVGVPNWKQDLQLLETYAIPTLPLSVIPSVTILNGPWQS